jgi:hypothetical protein
MQTETQKFDRAMYDAIISAVNNLPKEAIEGTKASDTRKGYDTTGYQYQFLVNVLNETVGPNGWSMEYKVVKELAGTYRSGAEYHELIVETKVDILDATRVCVGNHTSSSYGDALKGAITNSLKKTLGLFGIGKKAYEGALDDDYRPIPEPRPATPAAKPVAQQARICAKCKGPATGTTTVEGKVYFVCDACDPAKKSDYRTQAMPAHMAHIPKEPSEPEIRVEDIPFN